MTHRRGFQFCYFLQLYAGQALLGGSQGTGQEGLAPWPSVFAGWQRRRRSITSPFPALLLTMADSELPSGWEKRVSRSTGAHSNTHYKISQVPAWVQPPHYSPPPDLSSTTRHPVAAPSTYPWGTGDLRGAEGHTFTRCPLSLAS